MDNQHELILVSAATKAGETFVRGLIREGLPFAAIVNNKAERADMEKLGVKRIIMVDTTEESTWLQPDGPIGKVYLFETSMNLCCRYIRICRSWTEQPVYVITKSNHPRLIYKSLGATYVIHTNSDDVKFLIQTLVG
ncbi:hypothetical protein O9H85_24735 [Paenibacillus filicis]|uniref:RCK N-terminal domain-containing protein n=1 Tax=Paenibacillus gyeongsangnamensis TaxID=3388067 RepID=A0ABT4QF93_9BACL|nr:hypothetical protein [Paenibacillus filicis]MCZ8515554.1 hypothetical protein [Paenibacillus filicis]